GKWRNAEALSALDRNATLYVYCYTPTCHLAAEAALELTAQGYRVVEVEGGWERWVQDGFSIEKAAGRQGPAGARTVLFGAAAPPYHADVVFVPFKNRSR